MRKKKGLTLLEIIVSTVILTLTIAGFASVFISGKGWLRHSRAKINALELGKLFVDPLQAHVRQDTWASSANALYATSATTPTSTYCDGDDATTANPVCPGYPGDDAAQRTLNNLPYTCQYNIYIHPDNDNIRKVVATIRWTEPSL